MFLAFSTMFPPFFQFVHLIFPAVFPTKVTCWSWSRCSTCWSCCSSWQPPRANRAWRSWWTPWRRPFRTSSTCPCGENREEKWWENGGKNLGNIWKNLGNIWKNLWKGREKFGKIGGKMMVGVWFMKKFWMVLRLKKDQQMWNSSLVLRSLDY